MARNPPRGNGGFRPCSEVVFPTCPLEQQLNDLPVVLFDRLVTVRFSNSDADTSETPKEYHAHKGLIGHFSEYFRLAFDGEFVEGREGIVTLKHEELKGFQVFFKWMYTRRLYDDSQPINELSWFDYDNDMAEAYIFADLRQIPCLKNAIVDYSISRCVRGKARYVEIIKLLWENTPETDPIRVLYKDMLGMDCMRKTVWQEWTQLPKDLVWSLFRGAIGPATSRPITKRSDLVEAACNYHDHSENTLSFDPGECSPQ